MARTIQEDRGFRLCSCPRVAAGRGRVSEQAEPAQAAAEGALQHSGGRLDNRSF